MKQGKLARLGNVSLSYNPSNQGLKHKTLDSRKLNAAKSLSYNPSNQGLKLVDHQFDPKAFESLYPTIHQTKGWNSLTMAAISVPKFVFILQSIKPRVETSDLHTFAGTITRSLSYNPSNQGLKLLYSWIKYSASASLYPTIHQTKGWNHRW